MSSCCFRCDFLLRLKITVLYNFPTSTDRPFCRSYHVFNFICFDKFIGILSSMSLYACTPGVSRCSISGAYISYKLWRKQILVYRIQYHPVTNYIVKPRISFLLPSLTAVLPETDGFRISPRTSVFLMRFYKKNTQNAASCRSAIFCSSLRSRRHEPPRTF